MISKKRYMMQVKMKAAGDYQTNCYIVQKDGKELIIDPGEGAYDWVVSNCENPVAILNTHGHFDHVWSDYELKQKFNIPVYAPKGDVFMIESDVLGRGTPPCGVDVHVDGDEHFEVEGFEFDFFHFPGHTPGCSAVLIEDMLFSGDFIFQGSIGRVDFPFSSPEDMKKSIEKVLLWEKDLKIYPGHGPSTSLSEEKRRLPLWINMI